MEQALQNLMKQLDDMQSVFNTATRDLAKALDQHAAGFDTRLAVLRTQSSARMDAIECEIEAKAYRLDERLNRRMDALDNRLDKLESPAGP